MAAPHPNSQIRPLFPLNTVLLPGGILPLRIFEPRYLSMVGRCLREARGFGVCLIESGREAGMAARPHATGTVAEIIDWGQGSDGLLTITARGRWRYRLRRHWVEPDQLLMGELQPIDEPATCRLPEAYEELAELLRRVLDRLEPPFDRLEPALDDAGWVAARLIELLPLPLLEKQQLLELDDPLERLSYLLPRVRVRGLPPEAV